jgi:hypothetical protein
MLLWIGPPPIHLGDGVYSPLLTIYLNRQTVRLLFPNFTLRLGMNVHIAKWRGPAQTRSTLYRRIAARQTFRTHLYLY